MDLKKASFTSELERATKAAKWSDSLSVPSDGHRPSIKQGHEYTIQGNKFNFGSSHVSLLEFQNHLFYFFTTETSQNKSKG